MLTRKSILTGAACLILVCAGAAAAVNAVVCTGALEVRVREASGESSISLSMPAGLAQAALWALPDRFFRDHDAGVDSWVPVAREAFRSLESSSDFTLVRVESHGERIEVSVSAGNLLVCVDDGGDHVYVKVPIRFAAAVLSRVERAGGA